MMNKPPGRILMAIGVLTVLSCLFVLADYFALFGTNTRVKLDFVVANFRTIDQDTGGPVMEVGVRCFQQNNSDACTRRKSPRVGIVSVHVPVRRVITESLLFKQAEEIIKAADPKLNIMFLHKDYNNPTYTVLLDDLYNQTQEEVEISMPRRDWSAGTGNEVQ